MFPHHHHGSRRFLAPALLCGLAALVARPATAQHPRFNVVEATISDLGQAMAAGRVTSMELVDVYLARMAAYDAAGPALNAMLRLNPRAREEARALDAERRAGRVRGPWHGIPVVLKDNYSTADLPTSGGSLALAALQPTTDAFVVARLRAAGAIILGKTNLHELAAGITTISSLGGQTRNPYDPARCPGGSSGGTGAAVAASFAAIGWGSDTCGSIRYPSAFGSLFGLRPTQGLASRSGIIPLSHTQDTPGPLARTVRDLALGLDLTVGRDPADPDTKVMEGRTIPSFTDALDAGALGGQRIGVLANYFVDADAEVADTVRAALRAMQGAGAEVVPLTIGGLDTLLAGSSVINYETAADLRAFLAAIPGAPVHSLHEILAAGLYHDALGARFRVSDTLETGHEAAYRAAFARRALLQQRIESVLDSLHLDALAYPTLRQRPALIGDAQLGGNCQLASATGFPALSAPAGFLADGTPVGIELLGRRFTDAHLVAMAYAFEQAGPRRRAPETTPPLGEMRAGHSGATHVAVRAGRGTASGTFTFDAAASTLRWSVRAEGIRADDVTALVLRRIDGTGPGPVVQRMGGPGVRATSGVLHLRREDRLALLNGRLALSLVTVRTASPLDDGRLHLAAPATSR
jgi:Asp-tRNA(Asn)/Glu-tRNA(Gln) amidotransferase A subunit family amidase